jgi:molybdopterin converting factor small subunit
MPRITFSALSFLRKPLQKRGIDCCESAMTITEGMTAADLIGQLGLAREAVEGVFINGRADKLETLLKDGDRVALLPPGTPGPYRVLLRIKK